MATPPLVTTLVDPILPDSMALVTTAVDPVLPGSMATPTLVSTSGFMSHEIIQEEVQPAPPFMAESGLFQTVPLSKQPVEMTVTPNPMLLSGE